MKKILSFLAVTAVFTTITTSCTDNLAQKIDGTWETDLSDSDFATFTFNYDENALNGNGTFTEEHACPPFDFQLDDETSVNVSYSSTIDGVYRVDGTDLYTTYDLSTFKVTIEDLDMGFGDWQNDPDYTESDKAEIRDIINTITEYLAESFKESLLEAYKSDNDEGAPYVNLKVKENSITFGTSDVGTTTLTRK